jgi:hypothetical protein
MNHKYSTIFLFCLICISLFLYGIFWVMSLSSSDIDDLCSQNNMTLLRINGVWSCSNISLIGHDGTDGVNGLNGTNGVNGLNGTNGVNGLNGTNGVNGINGQNVSFNSSIFCYSNGTNCNLTIFESSMDYKNIALVNQTNNFLLSNLFHSTLTVFDKLFVNSTATFSGSQGSCSGSPNSACASFQDQSSCESNNNHGQQCFWSNVCSGYPQITCSQLTVAQCGNASAWCGVQPSLCSGTYTGSCECGGTYPGNCDCSETDVSCDGDNSHCSQGSCSSQATCEDTSGYCSGNSGCETYDNSGDCSADSNEYGSCSWSQNGCSGSWIGNTCSQQRDGTSCLNAGCSPNGYCRSGTYGCEQNCNDFNSNQGTCQSTSGCTWVDSYCGGGSAYPDCSQWSGNDCPNFCTTTYDCEGSLSCSSYTDSLGCNSESGCLWNVDNPNIVLRSNIGNDINISNDGSGNLIIQYTGIAWFSNNLSSTGYYTRTQVNNDTNVLNSFKDSSLLYNKNGTVNDSAFGNCSINVAMTDYTRPITVKQCNFFNILKKQNVCKNVTTYPYSKNVSMEDNTCVTAQIYHAIQLYTVGIKPDNQGNVWSNNTLVAGEIIQQSKTFKTTKQGKTNKSADYYINDSSNYLNGDGTLNDSKHSCYDNSTKGISTTCQLSIDEQALYDYKMCFKCMMTVNKPSDCASDTYCMRITQ